MNATGTGSGQLAEDGHEHRTFARPNRADDGGQLAWDDGEGDVAENGGGVQLGVDVYTVEDNFRILLVFGCDD